MSRLEVVYPEAVEHTKDKIEEDVTHFLGSKESLPSLKDYLDERSEYLQQIWINVWINKATGKMPRKDKKQYLVEKGHDVEGVDKKIINHLFRTEIKTYHPFQVIEWVKETFSDEHEWKDMYEQSRVDFLKYEKEKEMLAEKKKVYFELEVAVKDLIENESDLFYFHVRHIVAKSLATLLKNATKYKKVDVFALEEKLVEQGRFSPEDYTTLETFLEELTGDIHKTSHWGRTYYTYETYYFIFEKIINDAIWDFVPRKVLGELSPKLVEAYEHSANETVTETTLKKLFPHQFSYLNNKYMREVQEEYVEDLLPLANMPFEHEIHRKLYEKAILERERRKAEELAELKRKKEEEERMLEDIFGREYSPSLGRNMKYVLHIGETNTGKTHHALEQMKKANSGLYLAPLRLLALEVYDKLNAEGVPCSLKTGEEEKISPGSQHISCTVEMFHEKDFYDVVVIDEAQMITDKDRGFSWYKAITKANAHEVHIIGSRNARSIMLQLLGDSEIEIREYTRDIPLEVEPKAFNIRETKKGDALVCFSRRRVLETASRLQNDGRSVSMIYGSMPPETRKKQMQRFISGETTVIVATDAIGMGLNLPIRRIIFLENEKFDGTKRRRLTSQEVKQIAGRAGRKGIYNVGKVAFTSDIKMMKGLLEKEDEPVHTFAIAPTNSVFERFQKYSHDLGFFFELWKKFESPKGTKKATLYEERDLYELIRGTEIEARLNMMDLYGYLHLPFSSKEPSLTEQWKNTMVAIINGTELPEPLIKRNSLEELELSYKALGLHLLFLYRLGERTEAIFWERVREEISDEVHEKLKTDIRSMIKKCKRCDKKLPWDYGFQICDECHSLRYRRY